MEIARGRARRDRVAALLMALALHGAMLYVLWNVRVILAPPEAVPVFVSLVSPPLPPTKPKAGRQGVIEQGIDKDEYARLESVLNSLNAKLRERQAEREALAKNLAALEDLQSIPQGRYTREFRQEAVKVVAENKVSCREAAQRLSLAPSTLAYWVKAYKEGNLGEIGKTQKPLTEVEMELARTKKELAEVRMERDILKKAASYFAKESLPGTR